jgi:hypothetical protein
VNDRDPPDLLLRGYELYRRGGHVAEAEAWLYLGILLDTQPGRERDEEVAFRAAMASDDLKTATSAALHLGDLLDLMYDDRSAARAGFEFVEKHGDRRGAFVATERLAKLLAYEGDTEAAQDRARSFAIWFGDERNQDMSGTGASGAASTLSNLVGGRYTREPWRRFRRFSFRTRRRRQSVVARSELLTSWSNRIKQTRADLARRFWAWGEDDE